jgi:2,5-diketo-D-gluconate reductase B
MEIITVQGVAVPSIGFGTWPLRGEECRLAVEDALAIGYRHIDTAQGYENEAEVGQAIRNSGIPRDEIFLVTKVRQSRFKREDAIASTRESLAKLNADYIDLLLLHWPNDQVPVEETLTALRTFQEEGTVRHLGVSNFSPAQVEEAARYATIFCNQVQFHPYHPQNELIAQAQQMDYLFTAYSPVARGKVLQDPVLQAIGVAHGKTAVQVTLRWMVQQGLATIPKAGSEQHRRDNFAIYDFSLSDDEMSAIDGLSAQHYSVH